MNATDTNPAAQTSIICWCCWKAHPLSLIRSRKFGRQVCVSCVPDESGKAKPANPDAAQSKVGGSR